MTISGRAPSPTVYRSPSRLAWAARFENQLLGAGESWWTGRAPLFVPTVAEVPAALYLNFLARKSTVASFAPGFFRPLDIADDDTTLFSILLFSLQNVRPRWAPRALGVLAPRFMQSNWRLYGHLTPPGSDPQPGVLFIRTISTSLMLAAFGRRTARCFPLHRAKRMSLTRQAGRVVATIDPGAGSAPALAYEGEPTHASPVPQFFGPRFASYTRYAQWVIDQHLSLAVWPYEYIVQDMHLDSREAQIMPLRSARCRITGFDELVFEPDRPLDCFIVEGLQVYLDQVYRVAPPLHPSQE